MPRIRTIKPEFWSSPGIEELEPRWRLLYIAMWQWADDFGRGTAEPRELAAFAFPRENITLDEIRRGLDGIHRVFDVDFYYVARRPFYSIPSWGLHQKIDNRAKKARYPSPDDGEPFNPLNGQVIGHNTESSMGSTESSMGSTEISTDSTPRNRGTGEQRYTPPCSPPEPRRRERPRRHRERRGYAPRQGGAPRRDARAARRRRRRARRGGDRRSDTRQAEARQPAPQRLVPRRVGRRGGPPPLPGRHPGMARRGTREVPRPLGGRLRPHGPEGRLERRVAQLDAPLPRTRPIGRHACTRRHLRAENNREDARLRRSSRPREGPKEARWRRR